ncbi:MAG: ATPase, T2SS/T4P/T4SS family [Pirellulales bacterium]
METGSRLLEAEDSEPAATRLVDRLLAQCTTLDASDLHLAPSLPPYFRVHGVLRPCGEFPGLSADLLDAIAAELARRCGRPPLGDIGSLDGAITSPGGRRFRFNAFRRQNQTSIALRRLDERFRSLAELGLREDLYDLCNLPDGLVVVAGPTGAGKSTTLATLIDRINSDRASHIVTIEDPIEYLHVPRRSLVNQRQVGSDAESFYEALVASLRQDPDVVLVGEIRDLNTIRTAITAAETGHLVFTTVHAGDCVGAIERLVSVFPADEQQGIRRQLSLVLRCILAQHLLVCDGALSKRTIDGAQGDAGAIASEMDEPAPQGRLGAAASLTERGRSAPMRRQRVAASEVLMVNAAVANLIATGKSSQIYSALETGGPQGMHTLEEDLARLWRRGHLSEQSALAMARNPAVVRERYLNGRNSPQSAASGGRS